MDKMIFLLKESNAETSKSSEKIHDANGKARKANGMILSLQKQLDIYKGNLNCRGLPENLLIERKAPQTSVPIINSISLTCSGLSVIKKLDRLNRNYKSIIYCK